MVFIQIEERLLKKYFDLIIQNSLNIIIYPIVVALFLLNVLVLKLRSIDLGFINISLKLSNSLFLNIITLIAFLVLLLLCFRKTNKDRIFNNNGLVYLNFNVCFVRLLAFLSGYRKISAINMPIWMQFKLSGQTSWEIVYDELNKIDNEKINVEFINRNKNDKIVNLCLADTYYLKGKIPNRFNKYDTYYIEKSENGVKSYNPQFINEVFKVIGKIYDSGYVQVNIFSSTNPQHTIKIAREISRRKKRERHVQFFVYQSVGYNHMYNEEHKVIK